MRVKIGKTWFEPKIGEPIMVELTHRDKELIKSMQDDLSKYAVFDADEPMSVSDREEWMQDKDES